MTEDAAGDEAAERLQERVIGRRAVLVAFGRPSS